MHFVSEKNELVHIPLECINSEIPLHLLSQRDTIILKHLQHLLIILNRIEEIEQCDIDNDVVRQVFSLIGELCFSLKSYSQQIEMYSIKKYDPMIEYERLSHKLRENVTNDSSKLKCFDEKPIVDGEKLIFERRMMAVIALIALKCPALVQLILNEPIKIDALIDDTNALNGNEKILDLLIESLFTIGASTSTHLHRGLLESASLLLNAIALNYYQQTEENDLALIKLFGAVSFCQPDIFPLAQLTKFLEKISQKSTKLLCNRICYGGYNSLSLYSFYKIRRYSMDTCPLQIYASVLLTIFDSNSNNESIDNKNFIGDLKSLTTITISLMIFLRQCFEHSMGWLFKKNDNDGCCQCYSSIASTIIVLLHLCIKYWIQDDRSIGKRNNKNGSNI